MSGIKTFVSLSFLCWFASPGTVGRGALLGWEVTDEGDGNGVVMGSVVFDGGGEGRWVV